MAKYEEYVKQSFIVKYEKNVIFPSELGTCLRRIFLSRNENFIKNVSTMEMDLGEQFHSRIENYFVEKLGCKNEIRFEKEIEGIKMSGRIDLLCGNDLIELKTSSFLSYRVKEYHLYQVAVYYYSLKDLGYDIQNVYIIYLNRENQQVREFKLSEQTLKEYYEKAKQFIKDYKEIMNEKDYHKVKTGEKIFCKYCEFKEKCYGKLF
jgi:hypothetical protein